MMEFKTLAQQACYEKIMPWMREFSEGSVVDYNDECLFVTQFGSAAAYTRVIPWGEDETIILTRSCVVTNLKLTLDLAHYLLRENDNLYFGRFALDTENDVIFEHSLIGSTCSQEELKTSVIAVVKSADEYDDIIVQRWGGQRALDRWANVLPWK